MSAVRRAAAELVGTLILVAAVVGSGIAAQSLSSDVGLQLLENSLATGGVLLALIVALGPVSASFNPVVTLVEVALRRVAVREAMALIAAQVVGAISGAVLADLMFGKAAVAWSSHHRATGGHLLAETVATAGLVLVVVGAGRSGRLETVAVSVAGYIAGAYWFTSSTSFANPAVTIGRTFSNTFAGIAPASVAGFVLAQLAGGVVGLGLVLLLHPPVRVPLVLEEKS